MTVVGSFGLVVEQRHTGFTHKWPSCVRANNRRNVGVNGGCRLPILDAVGQERMSLLCKGLAVLARGCTLWFGDELSIGSSEDFSSRREVAPVRIATEFRQQRRGNTRNRGN